MSWALGLGRDAGERPTAIVALSGFMPVVEGLELDLSGLDGYPIAIGHGSFDDIISVQFGQEASRRVEAAGADLLYREYPLAHTIDPRFLPELRELVRRVTETGG